MTSKLSLKKRLLFIAIIGVIILILIELMSWAALSLIQRDIATYGSMEDERALLLDVATRGGDRESSENEDGFRILHPYVGYVQRHNIPEYLDFKEEENTVTIVIVGGSVARDISRLKYGEQTLLEELRKFPAYEGKNVRIINVSADGFRQPQQVLLINYLLTLGASIDVVVNLDGLNELYIPAFNDERGNFAHYPELWATRLGSLEQKSETQVEQLVDTILRRRITSARLMQHAPWRLSMTFNVLWRAYDQMLQKQSMHNSWRPDEALSRFQEVHGPVTASGFVITDSRIQDSMGVWERSSLLLHNLTEAQGIAYFHFLQPNQYLPDSKPMDEEERAIAIGDFLWSGLVKDGYPLLKNAGERLRVEGVNFYDLTTMFAETREPVYRDIIGHLNEHGNTMLGEAMGKAIVSVLSAQ